MAAGKRRQQLH